jgi:hypothetical protein
VYTFEIVHSPKLHVKTEGLALQLAFDDPEALFDLVEQMKELEIAVLNGLGYGDLPI